MSPCGIIFNAFLFLLIAIIQVVRFTIEHYDMIIYQIYFQILSSLLLYGFRVYLLYMVHTFEADFVLRSRVINNGT